MKRCYKCGEEKDLTMFSNNKTKKDGLSDHCRACHKAMRKRHYDANQQKIIRQVEERQNKLKSYIKDYKTKIGCVVCGENHPACLDLHHKDPLTKEINPSAMSGRGWSIERINKELKKCDVMCANCHRKHHYKHQ